MRLKRNCASLAMIELNVNWLPIRINGVQIFPFIPLFDEKNLTKIPRGSGIICVHR